MSAILCVSPNITAGSSSSSLCGCPWESTFSASRIIGEIPPLKYPVDTTNQTSPNGEYAIDTRVMYRFTTTQALYTKLCELNVSPTHTTRVNLVLSEFILIPKGKDQDKEGSIGVSMIVGYDNARNVLGGGAGTPDGSYSPNQSNQLQQVQVEENMRILKIKYSKHVVIQIFNSQVSMARNPQLSPILSLLLADITVLSYKNGEAGNRLPLGQAVCGPVGDILPLPLFIEVPLADLQEAIDVLSIV